MKKGHCFSPIALVFLLFSFSSARAASPNDAWAFARDAIDAFYVISVATTLHNKTPPNDADFDFAAHMATTIAESRGVKQARAALAPYSQSTDASIKLSYAAVSGSMLALASSFDSATDLYEAELNKSLQDRMNSVGTFGRQIIEISQTMKENWDFYMKMSATVGNVLVEESIPDLMNIKPEDMNKPISPYLRISSWQRDDLKRHIVDKFGSHIATLPMAKVSMNQLPARLLLNVLNDKWKTRN